MTNTTPKKTVVRERMYGVYVWEMPDGRYVGNSDGEFLSIDSKEGDIKRMAMLRQVVKSYGIEEGKPKYLPGRRKVTQGEYESMQERMDQGLIPDPADPGNFE